MKTKKQLIGCLVTCLVLSFVSAVYAAPPVEIIHGPAVTIVNSNLKPIPVMEVKHQPIAQELTVRICAPCGWGELNNCVPPCVFISPGWYGNGTIYTVPPDKYLIIEYFSCRDIGNGTSQGSYSTSYSFGISTRTAGVYVDHYLPTTPYSHPQFSTGGTQILTQPAFMSAGQRVQLYADSGSDVIVTAWRQNNHAALWVDDELITCSFSGYLADSALPVDIGPQ